MQGLGFDGDHVHAVHHFRGHRIAGCLGVDIGLRLGAGQPPELIGYPSYEQSEMAVTHQQVHQLA